ncbi:2,3-bisphosphoglycerate-independent phosphoglycerate mutase [Candidatus Phytoplasma meliae]|uniref:2,3-bisphosphoglycerate-independent phosphoglycerate mutase n=2 Tax=Candidatus Phytoplasma meliae TaxID=1848402 RepID=A0ABS5CYF7_9MOLU|nr:2,3-bisphosphoglycerate-independent phosphoglycerate mutase [Candidatus Phytoplasma meliae]MBP5836014.1 2,3-bisphosphoglycerate-independent phosphoglycerate mutase [Candidatus Phytoplasma meliae]
MNLSTKFVGLIILDGLGLSQKKENNAFYLAKTPYLDYLLKHYPHTTLKASGEAVGLPEGQMGNSEVGHLNLGAGRIVYQSLTQINKAIKDQSFFQNQAFLKAIAHVKKNNSKLHLLGLISLGGIHSHLNHFKALFDLSKQHGLEKKTYLHAFTDGRDASPYSGLNYLKECLDYGFQIASVSGRYYALDRDNNWDRLNLVYNMLTSQKAPFIADPLKEIQSCYQKGITDEFIKPFIVLPHGLIDDNDAIIFVNFRPDRAMRLATALSNPALTSAFCSPQKTNFTGDKVIHNLCLVTMTQYSKHVKGIVAFEKEALNNIYGEVIANSGLNQLRVAETEKYPHVTFFFDGGKELSLANADRVLIPSPHVATYDLKPEMSAFEITNCAKKAILSGKYQTLILNFANPDMVGHTGCLKATIQAIEAVDTCLQELVNIILSIGGKACILADHGNAEQMTDDKGNPHTAHTTNLVPLIVTDQTIALKQGSLCDVAPTLLALLNINKPQEMTGQSLIVKK